jgi:putative membrane protein
LEIPGLFGEVNIFLASPCQRYFHRSPAMNPHRFLLFAIALYFCSTLWAADQKRPQMLFNTDLNGGDLQFLMSAAEQGLVQTGLVDLAKSHARSSEVKDFIEVLGKQRAEQNEQIKRLADGMGIVLSVTLTKQESAAIEKLGKLEGLKFDKAFMEEMTKRQQDYASLFEQKTQSEDSHIKAFVTATLPVIKQQLALARNISGISPRAGTQPHFRTGNATPAK